MRLQSLSLDHFTVFDHLETEFCPGLNVVIGANGMGKSHLLKLAYACAWMEAWREQESPTKSELQRKMASRLSGIYRSDSLGRLVQRGSGKHEALISAKFDHGTQSWSFSPGSQREVKSLALPGSSQEPVCPAEPAAPPSTPCPSKFPVFIPTSEVLSLYPRFASLYRDYQIEVDETYYDLCLTLDRPLVRGQRSNDMTPLLEPLEQIIGGKIRPHNGRFYIQMPGIGELEIPLLAEGFRKIAAVAYLITNGSLLPGTCLFWDEPETNLNPQLISRLAPVFIHLASHSIQTIISTHSLFLLKQLYCDQQAHPSPPPVRYHAISMDGKKPRIEQSDDFTQIDSICALDAEILQADQLAHWLQNK